MRVKRYIADSMPDALHLIRKDLGKEAVILNTKEIRSGGFLGLFGKRKIEVMAAVDTSIADESSNRRFQVQQASVPSPAPSPSPSFAPTPGTASVTAQAPTKTSIQVPTTAAAASTSTLTKPIGNAISNNKNDSFITNDRITANQSHQPTTDLAEEVRQMKQLILRWSSTQRAQTWPSALQIWEERLRVQDFSNELIQQILNDALTEYEDGMNMMQQPLQSADMSEEMAAHLVRDALYKRLKKAEIKEIDNDTRIVHFVGPTGVGKTTTIAKLAAYQVLKHRRNIAFITADTYRIAAVEQLRTYANILDVPMAVVSTQQDMLNAIEKFADRDLIFMDTAGRNYRNEMFVSELNSLLKSERKNETFLVLSLTMKYNDMKAVTHNFARFSIQNVLFTKMDETDSFGPIFNLLDEFDLTLSYITNGQNVPEDITRINPDHIINKIMEGNGDA